MTLHHLAGAFTMRLVCLMAVAMMASVAVAPSLAAAQDSTESIGIGVIPTEDPDDQGEATEPSATETAESDPPPTEQTEGTQEEQAPPTEPAPTEATDPQEDGGRDNEAVGPGFVTLVIFTSDGNPTAEGTYACVGGVCQPAGGLSSGSKIVFDDVESGWRDVSVETGFRTGNATTSVQVVAGQGSHVELTLVTPVGAILEEPARTPVSATGPLRSAPSRAASEEQPPWSTNDVVVSSMPLTGGAGEANSSASPLLIAFGLMSAAATCAMVARWTSRSRAT